MRLRRSDTRGAADPAEGRARLAAEVGRLDPFSFWALPASQDTGADTVVSGVTGIFLIRTCVLAGHLEERRGRPVVAGVAVPSLRKLRTAASRLSGRLQSASVAIDVEPVLCLTHAVVGAPKNLRGVRLVGIDQLVGEITGRPHRLGAHRAQRAARTMGMQLAGDHRRHFVAGHQGR